MIPPLKPDWQKPRLSVSNLGRPEYFRQYMALRIGRPIKRKPRWTGLSQKQLGHAQYMAYYRKLKTELATVLAVV